MEGPCTDSLQETEPPYAYFFKAYPAILLFSLRRAKSSADIPSFLFLLLAPFLYILRFRGVLSTPIGKAVIDRNGAIRSLTYGLFKSHFCYAWNLGQMMRDEFFPIVADVGANSGDFTLTMSGVSDKIIAIEPSPQNVRDLRRNIRLNSLENVIIQNIAAHDSHEELSLAATGSNVHVVPGNNGSRVRGEPLDFLLDEFNLGSVDVLKIDVQGHEIPVLLGLVKHLTSRSVKLLIVEVHLKRGIEVEAIRSLMETYGYSLVLKDDYLFDQPHLYFSSSNLASLGSP